MSLRHRSRHTFPVLIASAALLVAAWAHQAHYDFQHDDAYISYRYAENWALGHGPVYNPGERVEGYSNFLYVLFLRECHALGLDIVRASRTLGTWAHFALVLMTYWFVTARLRRGPMWGVAAAAAVALHAAVAAWARSGLETVPFALVVFAGVSAFVTEHERRRSHLASGFLFGLGGLLRADGGLFVLLTLAFLVRKRVSAKRVASFAATAAALVIPHLVWRWTYYGYPFPNSYYLKTGGDIVQQLRGVFYTYNFVEPFGGPLLFALPFVLAWCRDAARDDIRGYLALLVTGVVAYVVYVGGDHMPMVRFFVPVLAPLAILLVESVTEIGRIFAAANPKAGRVVAVAAASIAVFAGVAPTLNARRLPATHAISGRTFVAQWRLAGLWMRDHLPAGTLLATASAGAVAFESKLPVIDMLGVNDVHIAHLTVEGMGHGTAGHEKRDIASVLSRRPDVFFSGVEIAPTPSGQLRTREDGSVFRTRCESLGPGPVPDPFGVVRVTTLYICLEERVAGAAVDAAAPSDPRSP